MKYSKFAHFTPLFYITYFEDGKANYVGIHISIPEAGYKKKQEKIFFL